MLASLRSATLFGVEACPIHVEVGVSFGMPVLTILGLRDASVRESRDRVKSAISNSGFEFPAHRVTVNLALGDLRKAGSAFDLPMALGILAAQGVVDLLEIGGLVVLGELSLDGRIQAPRGVLAIAAAARRDGMAGVLLPRSNASEATVVAGRHLLPVSTLAEVADALKDPASVAATSPTSPPQVARDVPDPADVRGYDRLLKVACTIGDLAGAKSIELPHRGEALQYRDSGA